MLTTTDIESDGRAHSSLLPTFASSGQPFVAVTGGNHISNRGTLNIYNQTTGSVAVDELARHSAPNAIHTSSAIENQGICVPGTRRFTLQRLQSLVASENDTDPDIIWMHGPAGAGKSAIMRTLAKTLDDEGVLLGSFFFFRSDHQRNSSTPFISTLALQAFTSIPTTQPYIQAAIQSNPTIFSQSVRRQLRILLETPLKLSAGHEPKWTKGTSLVLVIDGLDECFDADGQVEVIQAMGQLASTTRSSTGRCIKILIASRPEVRIQDELDDRDNSGLATVIKLDPSDANIDLFFDTRLAEIRRRKRLPEAWPCLEQIAWLKEKSSNHYSFAQISTTFLAGGDPVERLKMLQEGIITHGLTPFGALDALYAFIFHQIPPEMRPNALLLVRLRVDEGWHYRDWSHDTHLLEAILSFPTGYFSRLSPYLSSILDIDRGDFTPYHATLRDFLKDPLRSQAYSLFIDLPTLSTAVIEGLLGVCVMAPERKNYHRLFRWIRDDDTFFNNFLSLRIAPTLGRLMSSLPTMDILTFGYCNCFLSTLLPHLQDRPSSISPAEFDIIQALLSKIRAIQQIHLTPYEKLDAEGDDGLGLLGLLLLFASDLEFEGLDLWYDGDPVGLRRVVSCLVRANRNVLDRQSLEQDSRSLFAPYRLADQLSASKREGQSWGSMVATPVYGAACFSGSTNDAALGRCLSRTIGLFLDLPSVDTRIHSLISNAIPCTDHALVEVSCKTCMENLERLQTSAIHAMYHFCSGVHHSWPFRGQSIDDDVLVRSFKFVRSSKVAWDSVELVSSMAEVFQEQEKVARILSGDKMPLEVCQMRKELWERQSKLLRCLHTSS